MRQGVRIAVDLGAVRVGVAASDPDGKMAIPIGVWPFLGLSDLAQRIGELVAERSAIEVVVGMPFDLRGKEGVAGSKVRTQVQELVELLPGVTFRLVDERFTSAAAAKTSPTKDSRRQREVIDALAATVLLETALQAELAQGVAPGERVGGGHD